MEFVAQVTQRRGGLVANKDIILLYRIWIDQHYFNILSNHFPNKQLEGENYLFSSKFYVSFNNNDNLKGIYKMKDII